MLCPAPSAAERAGPVELRDRGRIVGVALERTAEAGLEAAALLALGRAADGEREIAAGDGLVVVEGLVDDRLRVDVARVVVAAATGDQDRYEQRERREREVGADAGQVLDLPS